MGRFYHYAFIGLISLLIVILLALLQMVADVSFSPTELTESNAAWTARKIKLSAELAFYNYWKHPLDLDLVNTSATSLQVMEDELVQSPEGRKIDGDHGPISTARLSNSSSDPPSQKEPLRNAATFAKDILLSKNASNRRDATASSENTGTEEPSPISHWPRFGDKFSLSDAIDEHPVETFSIDNNEYPHSDEEIEYAHTDEEIEYAHTDEEIEYAHTDEDIEYPHTDEEYDDADADLNSTLAELEKEHEQEENGMPVHDSADEEKVNVGNATQNRVPQSPVTLLLNPHDHATSTIASSDTIKPSLMAKSTDIKFHMPCRKVYRPVKEIVTASWMKPLLRILSSFEGKQVTLVIANKAYQDVLLNWLISARVKCNPAIENIIVVCLDGDLYKLLQSRNIPSIVAQFGTVLSSNHRFRRFFELIMMMRLAFMRLINRLGYDCAMYDIDAIILKNPQPLYDKYADVDIIGSRGELPRSLLRRWHVTICIGTVFIRSNTRTELYWEAVYSVRIKGGGMANDQIRLNYGLQKLHIQWENSNYAKEKYNTPAVGSSSNGLKVVVLPFNTVCRYGCQTKMRDTYYIWHKGGSRDKESKKRGAKRGRTWFLKDDWNELHSNLKKTEWLKFISIN